jgi:hypothetical protein
MTVALRKVRCRGKSRHCERSGDGQGFGHLSGDGVPKANLQAHRRTRAGFVVSAIEKTCLFSMSSFEIVWEFLVAQKKLKSISI